MRGTEKSLALITIVALVGCAGGSYASRSRTRYVAAHGQLPLSSEIRIDEFLADYDEALPNPAPHAVGVTIEGARAQWSDENEEALFVVQTAIRGRNPDVRPPLALMLVVDRSGSMAEADKMTYVRAALHRLIAELDPRDAIGITAFDDVAEIVVPLTLVSEPDALHRAIDTLYPRGSTNLSQGLEVGYGGLAQAGLEGYLRRVVVLTDAVANVGETDVRRIAEWAQRGDEAGIRLSAIGVGLEHRDDVLAEMARLGDGNHYFLDSPEEIERVFQEEVHGLLEDVADQVSLTFTPMPGVEIVNVDGGEARPNGAHWQVDLGRIGAMRHRVVLWTLRGVDPLDRTPAVGRFTLDYTDMRSGETVRREDDSPVFAVTDASEGTVARNAAVAWMARDLRMVCLLAERGEYAGAQARLDRVRAVMGAIQAARPSDSELTRDLAMLEDFARALSDRTGEPVRSFRARVSVRYEGG